MTLVFGHPTGSPTNLLSGVFSSEMRKLLQFGTMILMMAALLPLVELCDQWDPPGPADDTEMAVFGFVLVLSLVLLVCRLIASTFAIVEMATVSRSWKERDSHTTEVRSVLTHTIVQGSPPLRI